MEFELSATLQIGHWVQIDRERRQSSGPAFRRPGFARDRGDRVRSKCRPVLAGKVNQPRRRDRPLRRSFLSVRLFRCPRSCRQSSWTMTTTAYRYRCDNWNWPSDHSRCCWRLSHYGCACRDGESSRFLRARWPYMRQTHANIAPEICPTQIHFTKFRRSWNFT